MEKKYFNWGLLGPRRIANNFAKGFQTAPEARLLAVASRNDEQGYLLPMPLIVL